MGSCEVLWGLVRVLTGSVGSSPLFMPHRIVMHFASRDGAVSMAHRILPYLWLIGCCRIYAL